MQLNSFRTLGRSGLRGSPITLGGLAFGDADRGADDQTSTALLDRYLAAGGNFIDTANVYNGGRSEETIGAYLDKQRGLRDRLVIATKFTGGMFPGDPNGGGAGRKAIMQQVEGSLRRLGTDYIDLYWQHNWDRHTPLDETLSTLDDLVRAGKIRYIGLSDTPAWAVARMATIAGLRGWAQVAAIQVEYSLLSRTVEGEQFGVARELGARRHSVEPAGQRCTVTGKYTRENASPAGSGRTWQAARHLSEETFAAMDLLRRISEELRASTDSVGFSQGRRRSAASGRASLSWVCATTRSQVHRSAASGVGSNPWSGAFVHAGWCCPHRSAAPGMTLDPTHDGWCSAIRSRVRGVLTCGGSNGRGSAVGSYEQDVLRVVRGFLRGGGG